MTSSQPIPPAGFTPQAQQQPQTSFNPLDVQAHAAVSSLNLEGFPSNSKQSNPTFGFLQPLANAWSSFHSHRASLALPNPGTIEGLQREVKSMYHPIHCQTREQIDLYLYRRITLKESIVPTTSPSSILHFFSSFFLSLPSLSNPLLLSVSQKQ